VSQSAPLDFPKLLSEINAEVKRRQLSGELPSEFERELNRTFARYAPVGAIDADFDTVVDWIEGAAAIDTSPSTVSAYPGVAQMKRVIAKAIAFELRHIATQVSGVVEGVGKALRILDDRVVQLERVNPRHQTETRRQLERLAGDGDTGTAAPSWDGFILDSLGPPAGRVLHADAGDGRLVDRLVASGLDAYGVEPSEAGALAASDRVPDVRSDDVLSHLRTLPGASLGGLVLSGCVERLAVDRVIELIELAMSRLVPGGALVVISAAPTAWIWRGPALAIDLADGRPMHPETWEALLSLNGFVGTTVQHGEPALGLAEVPGTGELAAMAEVANANFSRLIEAVLGPADYAISATVPT